MQSYSFQEGTVLGGPILFKEPDEDLSRRIKMDKIYWLLLPVCLILAITYPYILALIFKFKLVSGVAEAAGIFTVIIVLFIFNVEFWKKTPRTSVVVYRDGISLGYGIKPYYRFSDLHYVEEFIYEDTQGFIHTYIGLTSNDGNLVRCFKELRIEKVYKDFLNTLTKHFSGLKKGIPWTKDAESLISSMVGPKGPMHFVIEQMALHQHVKMIDLEFIRTNWQNVSKDQRFSYEFRKLAKKRWGNSQSLNLEVNPKMVSGRKGA